VSIPTGVSEILTSYNAEVDSESMWSHSKESENKMCRFKFSIEEYARLYQQSQIYGKELEVARKGNYDFDTYDIVMKYLQKAKRKVGELMLRRKEQAKVHLNGTSEKEMQRSARPLYLITYWSYFWK